MTTTESPSIVPDSLPATCIAVSATVIDPPGSPPVTLDVLTSVDGVLQSFFELRRGDDLLVRFHPDGSLTCGEGYAPDDASAALWLALASFKPIRDAVETMKPWCCDA